VRVSSVELEKSRIDYCGDNFIYDPMKVVLPEGMTALTGEIKLKTRDDAIA
jgi:hypothetical protein